MAVQGGVFHPGDLKMMAAQALQMVFFGGLAVALIGKALLPAEVAKLLEQYQMPILGGCFMCNVLAGNLLNTGAFEVSFNGEPVWSKIDTGRFPQLDEMRTALASAGLVSPYAQGAV